MRTFDEISEDIRHASDIIDAEALRALAEEMQALGTPRAMAAAEGTMGIASMRTGDYSTALEHYRRALALFEELGNRVGVATVTGNMGIVYQSTGDYPAALEHYRRAQAVHEELDDRTGAARIIGNMGIVYVNTGDYSLALEHYRRALAVHEELGVQVGAASVIGSIGSLYRICGDYPTALEHHRRALAIYEELGARVGVARETDKIGIVYRSTGDYQAALEHYRRALDAHEELGDRSSVALVTGNMGNVYIGTGDYHAALEHYRRALALHEELGQRADVALVIGNIIESLKRLDRYDEAEELLERQAVMQMDDPVVRSHHSANRAALAEHNGDLDTAQRFYMEALTIANESGVRDTAAQMHEALRDLAQKRNDFAGYIEHNAEFLRITEEIRGKEAMQRMAVMEAERKAEAVERERDKERALLYGALPKAVADRMIRGEKVTGDHFEHAAVLFIDVASFTTHTATMHPGDVVLLLEDLFSRMDNICDHHGVVKIKTIGDSYMCFRGDGTEAENAQSIARVALDVARSPFTWPDGRPLVVRMGAHIGPATAGVIGTQRLQYDVWGDTVNVASRMESHGEPGRIHVSDAFAAALLSEGGGQRAEGNSNDSMTNDSMTLLERGVIDIKGKGPMTTYWLS